MPNLTKFQRIVNRLMTVSEVKQRARTMDLKPEVVEHIVKKFEYAHSYLENNDDEREEDVAGDNGQLCCGQTHEGEFVDLQVVMGYDEDEESTTEDYEKVERVWAAFFSE